MLTGRSVLITGAARGLGARLARRFAQAGADLALSTRPESRDALDRLAESLRHDGIRTVVVTADLAAPAQRARLVDDCRAELGRIDILVNNAGIEIPGPFATHPPECMHELIETNLMAPMQLARHVLPEMLERGSGHIVNIAAIAGHLPMPFHATYGAAAAGLLSWSASVREVPSGRVCDAVIDAITHDRGEVLLWPGPIRPWLALMALAPRTSAALWRWSGLRGFLEERARRANDGRG